MVAYSFRPMFVDAILAGTKRQTIRAERKRHVRPGEELQLYTGMRTQHCRLIGRSACLRVSPIRLWFADDGGWEGVQIPNQPDRGWPNDFAQADGFLRWADLKAFWREHHPKVDVFSGVLIEWGDLLR